jgi:lysophospholipase L1-like esterase
MNKLNNRRSFIKKSIMLSSIPLFSEFSADKTSLENGENYTFLFQGDSITDGNRTRNNDWNHVMGHGFANNIASKLWYKFPEKKFHFFNRGISGNKVTDLEKRWNEDTLALKPDLLNILVGINETEMWLKGDTKYSPEFFEESYRNLLKTTKNALPNMQLVLCEPFILPVGRVKDKLEIYTEDITKRQEIVKKLSIEFDAIHIPFQAIFNKALERAEANYWIWDGIHPMPAGHELMALEWIKIVSKKIKFIR